jgi:hypothetical protein
MTKTFRLAGLIILTLIISCTKNDDYTFRNYKPDIKHCQVTRIIHWASCCSKDTMVFSYNQWGDPVSIKRLPYAATGAPHYVFMYDKKRRLTDVVGMYQGGGSGEVWHKYFYSNAGNSGIIVDSAYAFFILKNGMIISDYPFATYFTYDKTGRIIKDSIVSNAGEYITVNNYAYDANGNLVGRNYDDKLNIHLTNKIWMFFDRDYSVNNPIVADVYNSSGLPVKFDSRPSSKFLKFMNTMLFDAEISYDCK